MEKIKIFADSTCDLLKDLVQKYDIQIIPLNIVMDEKSYLDGVELTPDEIYEWSDKTGQTPKTAAVGFETAWNAFSAFDDKDTHMIVFGISEQMSTTCNVFRLIADELKYAKLHVIDSMNLSTGIGLQVIRAAEMALEGKSAEEIVAGIEAVRDKVRASFVVDSLTFLHRGGRCSAVTALFGGALKIKPQISVVDGKMGVAKKFRGNIEGVIMKYVEQLTPELMEADSKRVFITHSGCSLEVVNAVKAELSKLNYFEEIIETRAGGVISSHCGPNTLGVLFYEK